MPAAAAALPGRHGVVCYVFQLKTARSPGGETRRIHTIAFWGINASGTVGMTARSPHLSAADRFCPAMVCNDLRWYRYDLRWPL